MLKQIRLLTKLELCNLYNLNVFRFSKDNQKQKKTITLMILWCFLIAGLVFYVGSLSYDLLKLELAELIPAYLITLASLLIFFFGIFKAGSIIFRKGGYDILCSLPVKRSALVISRFLRLYIENLVLSSLILLPGLFVYTWFLKPSAAFYIAGALTLLALPLLPLTAAILIGAVITGISSRMKHKNLAAAGLTILFALLIICASSMLSFMEDSITPEMLRELSTIIMGILKKIYPPAVWFGSAIITGNLGQCFLCACLFLSVFAAVEILVSIFFHSICQSLFVTSATHDYEIETLKKSSLLTSLCKREFKRYFSSSIYVTNTIISPIMGCILSVALFFTGSDSITKSLPFPLDLCSLAPFVIGAVFSIMPATSTSISMEGKNWWIIKSLPLSPKSVLNAKILMNLLLILPFYLISEAFLIPALKPTLIDAIFLILIPAVMILFSCVYALTINLHFPVLSWENEVTIVKQSFSSFLGGMGTPFLSLLSTLIIFLLPPKYTLFAKLLLSLLFLITTTLLHHKITHPSTWQRCQL